MKYFLKFAMHFSKTKNNLKQVNISVISLMCMKPVLNPIFFAFQIQGEVEACFIRSLAAAWGRPTSHCGFIYCSGSAANPPQDNPR